MAKIKIYQQYNLLIVEERLQYQVHRLSDGQLLDRRMDDDGQEIIVHIKGDKIVTYGAKKEVWCKFCGKLLGRGKIQSLKMTQPVTDCHCKNAIKCNESALSKNFIEN